MSTFQKQLSLHRLPLPITVIDIINSYVFIDIRVKTKETKDKIMMFINKSIWVGRCLPSYELSDGAFIFLITTCLRKNVPAKMGARFCTKCGDYCPRPKVISRYDNNVPMYNERIDKVMCKC